MGCDYATYMENLWRKQDNIAPWLEAEGWIEDKSLKDKDCVKLADFHKDYVEWSRKNKRKALGKIKFKERLFMLHDIASSNWRKGRRKGCYYYQLRKRLFFEEGFNIRVE